MAKTSVKGTADAGMVGLGVMGRNLALNMADHGFQVAAFDISAAMTKRFVKENPDTRGGLVGCDTLRKLVANIKRPRKIVLLIPAGNPVDEMLKKLIPLLSKGDIVVDGGNSLWTDTIRREKELAAKGLCFFGSGVSGGEEGARFGPSLMPSGSKEAWKQLKPIWTAIAAKVDSKTGKPIEGAAPGKPVKGGVPCTTYIGTDGAGHYVKMVHNGIEYADMQLIAESYDLLHRGFQVGNKELAGIFNSWNAGVLESFLIEITAKICAYAQGLDLIETASNEYGWNVNLAEIARIWKGGCIIRARFLDEIMQVYANGEKLANLMVAPAFSDLLAKHVAALREVVAYSALSGIPTPALSASLAYFDSYRTADLPQNLTQAQRDAFGAHTFVRKDKPESGPQHVDWL